MWALGLGFKNPVGTWGVRDVCLCCGGVEGGGVGGQGLGGSIAGGGRGRHNLHSVLRDRCGSSTACRLCRLDPIQLHHHVCW